MLRIWGRTTSSNVQKVLWCLDEIGLAYDRIDAGGKFGVVDTPEYRAMNPNAFVPTIDDDGFILWESNVIVRYLSEKHSKGTLFPTDVRERFVAEQWMDWQTNTLWPSYRNAFWQLVRAPADKRDEAVIAKATKATERTLEGLETRLGKTRFVAGDAFTMGDIPVGVIAYRALSLTIKREDFPNIARWFDSLTERPGYRQFIMQPLS